ncbi:MAG: alanyl-tRNA editing protein [Gemmatimonadetes bacterium]|jgi:alanyl-tRNA synthetase|nr:alanyl-tRNA editing protein [Gemmatimonadota bacterium]MBK7830999.1 alanyl-tRNA editing protein [Gemmatimonadota bacterium]MBK8647745.1 alanyl-tRNA editing protein [Gemmatimonadota bacterium]MBP9105198.1 alanyl-tRNA editing protein [Gemmatimonadaceae bacterium]
MTDRLYYTDAYCARFGARVTSRAEDGRRVYLDRSAFYPTSGGQRHDLGTLGGVAVTDVVDEDDRVAHVLAASLDADEVEGVVDWPRRWDHMQQHTGQHLLSAIGADRFGWETVSVHFGAESSTIDFGVESIGPETLQELERLANAGVTENRPVTVTFEEAEMATGLRKPSDRGGVLRIVSIEGIDRSACGGTHVRATGEIGAIVLRRVEKVRKATRVEFLCGMRAIARVRGEYDVLARLANGLSCSIDELPTLVPAQAEQLRALENDRRRLEGEVNAARARDVHAALPPGDDGVRRLLERRAGGKVDDARALALAFAALPKGVVAVAVAAPPAILVAASDDSGVDAGRLLKEALGAVGGRGGGSARLAQGTVPDAAALETVIAALGFTSA